MKHFLLALQFLTIIPVRVTGRIKDEDIARSLFSFPLVGFLIGSALAAFASVFSFLPTSIMAALILILSAWLTGGLHLDGFADSCDGLCGHFSKKKRLEIMKDSRTGAMGVIGLISLQLLKYSLLAALPSTFLWKALIIMITASRWSQVLACFLGKYPRSQGKAKIFIENACLSDMMAGGLYVCLLFGLLAGITGLLVFITTLVITFLFVRYVHRKIGGMTGDTIGATSEITETAALLMMQILVS